MSRVFWDAMLLIYLLDENKKYGPITQGLLTKSFRRDDQLFTSYLALAEALVGIPDGTAKSTTAIDTLKEVGFDFLQFDQKCVAPFRMLRRDHGLKGPDSMHLACAAAHGVEMFLTGDKQLLKKSLHVPGIHFIVDFENAPL